MARVVLFLVLLLSLSGVAYAQQNRFVALVDAPGLDSWFWKWHVSWDAAVEKMPFFGGAARQEADLLKRTEEVRTYIEDRVDPSCSSSINVCGLTVDDANTIQEGISQVDAASVRMASIDKDIAAYVNYQEVFAQNFTLTVKSNQDRSEKVAQLKPFIENHYSAFGQRTVIAALDAISKKSKDADIALNAKRSKNLVEKLLNETQVSATNVH